jgi:hypothetical protein
MELLFSAPDGRDRAIDSNKYHTLVRAVLSSAQSKAQLIYHQAMKNLGCWRADADHWKPSILGWLWRQGLNELMAQDSIIFIG